MYEIFEHKSELYFKTVIISKILNQFLFYLLPYLYGKSKNDAGSPAAAAAETLQVPEQSQ